MTTKTAYAPLVMDLAQGSEDWKTWRNRGIGSSDAAAIIGTSPWTTTLALWELKTGRRQPPATNAAMQRGSDLEVYARREFEFEQGGDFRPACLVHPDYPFLKASLDGWSSDHETVLEIKAPGQKAHATALEGRIPDYYVPQVMHLLLVSGARWCHYWSYDPDQGGVLVTVERDDHYISFLQEREIAFWQCVEQDQAPTFGTGSETLERTDEDWRGAALEYQRAKLYLAEGEAWEKRSRERLIALADGQKCSGFGVRVTPVESEGRIDWKAFHKEVQDVTGEPWDTAKYRGQPIQSARITVENKS